MNEILRELIIIYLAIAIPFMFVIAFDGPPKSSEFKEESDIYRGVEEKAK